MAYSRYIGRVGALAVALGVGCAVASPAGVTWADPADSANPATDTGATEPGDQQTTDPSGPVDTDTTAVDDSADHTDPPAQSAPSSTPPDASPTAQTIQVADGVTVSSSGGSHPTTETEDEDEEPDDTDDSRTRRADRTVDTEKPSAALTAASPSPPQAPSASRTPTPAQDEPRAIRTVAPDVTATTTLVDTAALSTPVATPPAPSPIVAVLNTVVAPLLSPFFGALPTGPTQSPLAWLFMAVARRQIGEPTAAELDSQRSVAALAIANQAPTVSAQFESPVATTGAVTGKLVGVDPEGNAVTYKLTAAPSTGTLVFNSTTGTFTYTPTTTQRINAGVTPTTDTIAMTVTVSDGTNSVPTVVDIPVSAAPITKLAEIGAANDSTAVVVTATRAYVTNRTAGTVTVIDTTTNTVIGTINVGPAPDGLAIKPDGTRLYVSSLDNNTVTVVNTATSAVVKTVAVAKPSAMAMSSSGSVLYVTNRDAGTVTKISPSTNSITGTVKLPTGSRPTGIVVSPDRLKIYVISTKADGTGAVSGFAYTATSATVYPDLPSAPTSLAVSPDNKRLYVGSADGKLTVYDTGTRAVLGSHTVGGPLTGLTVSKDGTVVTVVNDRGWITAVDAATGTSLRMFWTRAETNIQSVAPALAATADGTQLYVTDYDSDKVYVVSLLPPNNAPRVTPSTAAPNTTTGAVNGSLGANDIDKDALKYTVTGAPTKGTVTVRADGTFTYTPTAAARHAASTTPTDARLTTDSFTVAVSDGRYGVSTTTVTVTISPTNKVPTATKTVGTPNTTTGVVTGKVTVTDGDKDVITYTASTPAKGSVVVGPTGSFTYTPTAAARHAAAKPGAPATAKQDTFTITVDDGHGGVLAVPVTVTVSPANAKPSGVGVTGGWTNPNSAVVTGTLTATDADNDTLTYTSTAPTKGTLVLRSDGKFTYTPTAAARQAASSPTATTATKTDTVTITVNDGYGGATTYSLKLSVTPYGHVNNAPTNAGAIVNDPTMAIGGVVGKVTVDDAERDVLTYTLASGPAKGLVSVDAATGVFTYVPNLESRYAAQQTPGVDTDSFTVTVTDGYGGTTTATVSVQVAPPSSAATAIDQRSTTVAVAAQEMLFYSDEDLNRALDLMKASGVDTIRILIPWAAVEPQNDVWTWGAVDRMVVGAVIRDMKVLGVLNSPPEWAVTPGTQPIVGSPDDPAEYAEFAGAAATRYKGLVSAYEIWNEPNGQMYWQPKPNAADYTEILKAGYTAIKAADPDAVVIGGVVGSTLDWGDLSTNPVRFVSEMYDAGAAGYFDALAFHPYHYSLPFSQGAPHYESPLTQAQRIHALMVAHGDGNKKIWATEYGQPVSEGSEAEQAAYTGDFLRAWRDLDFAGPAFIHTIRDQPHLNPVEASMGLFTVNWERKPVLGVVEDVIDENRERLGETM